MAFRALRRNAAEIDEQHLADSDRSASRRRFLTRAAAGGAVAVGASALPLGSLVPGASAQTTTGTQAPGGTTPGTTAAPAATAGDPPVVTGDDLETVVFLQSIELGAIEAYKTMTKTGKVSPAVTEDARQFILHHAEHASALAKLAGGAGTTTPNPRLVSELTPLMENAADQKELATLAFNMEEKLAATYAQALGDLADWQAAAVASKILPVDSQHAVVWSQVMVPDQNEWATEITRWIPNFQTVTGAIDMTEYPAS